MITLNVLNIEDIEEKIRLNQDVGVDIFRLQEDIKKELKEFQWMKIRAEVQCQCYSEQLEHIANRIKDGRIYREPGPNEGPSDKKDDGVTPAEAPTAHPTTDLPTENPNVPIEKQ